MEKAFELDPRFMEPANNLAWVLATQEYPDADRAEQLIRRLADVYEHLGEANFARLHRESAEKP